MNSSQPIFTESSVRVAAVQMVSCADLEQNLSDAAGLIQDASEAGAKLVVLPEYFAYMGLRDKDKLQFQASAQNQRIQRWLSLQAQKNKVWLVGGSHPAESEQKGRAFGRCFVYNDNGSESGYYDKIHLFDVSVGDNVGSYRESKYTEAGSAPFCFNSPWGKIGVAICYDLRFPELFRQFSKAGCELIVLPAAFTENTGKAHWHTLLKARAIENMSALIAAAQGGHHQNGRYTYGHSLVVDCWGSILAEKERGAGIVVADIDLAQQAAQRKSFPALEHRRIF